MYTCYKWHGVKKKAVRFQHQLQQIEALHDKTVLTFVQQLKPLERFIILFFNLEALCSFK